MLSRRSLLSDILKVTFIFLAAVILLSVVSFFLLRTIVRGNEVDVPNVIGKSFAEAARILNEHGLLTPKIEGYKYSADLPEDYVVEQRPVPKQKMKAERAIRVFLSRGTEARTVPRVIDEPLSEAESILKSLGLEVGSVVRIHSDDFPQKGIIIAHTPPANVTVQRGSKVNLLVSLGAHSIRLISNPDLRGMKLQSASELLESSGLKLGRITREVSSVVEEADIVLEQTPEPNDRVESGIVVDVVVSSSGEPPGTTSRMVVLRYPVPARPSKQEDLSPRRVKIVIEHEGGRRTIVDKMFAPGRLLEYPLRIVGRGIAKIYVDDMEWPIETEEL